MYQLNSALFYRRINCVPVIAPICMVLLSIGMSHAQDAPTFGTYRRFPSLLRGTYIRVPLGNPNEGVNRGAFRADAGFRIQLQDIDALKRPESWVVEKVAPQDSTPPRFQVTGPAVAGVSAAAEASKLIYRVEIISESRNSFFTHLSRTASPPAEKQQVAILYLKHGAVEPGEKVRVGAVVDQVPVTGQGLQTNLQANPTVFSAQDIQSPGSLTSKIRAASTGGAPDTPDIAPGVSSYLAHSPAFQQSIATINNPTATSTAAVDALVLALNQELVDPDLYDAVKFKDVATQFSAEALSLIQRSVKARLPMGTPMTPAERQRLNRLLLEAAYPELRGGVTKAAAAPRRGRIYYSPVDPNIANAANNNDKAKDLEVAAKFEGFTVKLLPSEVQEQELIDGTTAHVFHMKADFENPSILGGAKDPRVFLKSNNLFSTRPLDKDAGMELDFGLYGNFAGGPAKPDDDDRAYNLEAILTSNQTASNVALKITGGIRNPYSKTFLSGNILGSLLQSEACPLFNLGLQDEQRVRQDFRIDSSHSNKNSFQLVSSFQWNTLHLFAGSSLRESDVSIEVLAKAWWFPSERASGGAAVRRTEGRIEASLLIPLTIPLFRDDTGPGTRIRIKYVDGADEANRYARSSHFTVGFEAIKTF